MLNSEPRAISVHLGTGITNLVNGAPINPNIGRGIANVELTRRTVEQSIYWAPDQRQEGRCVLVLHGTEVNFPYLSDDIVSENTSSC